MVKNFLFLLFFFNLIFTNFPIANFTYASNEFGSLQNIKRQNYCPTELTIEITCPVSNNKFQLLNHIGIYVSPRMEFDQKSDSIVCSYESKEWVSKYKYILNSNERTLTVSSLRDLSNVVHVINSFGFKVEHFGERSIPISTIVYKNSTDVYVPDQMFVFSGLESTFDEDGFSIQALEKQKFSTVVINERYFKSQDVAADTFQTGSNCMITVL